jgi:transposase
LVFLRFNDRNCEPSWFRWRLSSPGEDESMAAQRKYPEELRERATRMALEARRDPATARGAIKRIADQLGVHPEALRTWVRQAEIDEGARTGTISGDARRIAELERENRELRRANEILRTASAFFAAAEVDRRLR